MGVPHLLFILKLSHLKNWELLFSAWTFAYKLQLQRGKKLHTFSMIFSSLTCFKISRFLKPCPEKIEE